MQNMKSHIVFIYFAKMKGGCIPYSLVIFQSLRTSNWVFFPFQAGRPTEQMGHGFPWLPMKHLSSEARTPEQQGVGAAAFVDEWSTPLSCLCRSVIWSLPWGYAKEHYPRLENENAEVSIEYGGLDLTRTLWNWQRALIIFQSKPEPVFFENGFSWFPHVSSSLQSICSNTISHDDIM